MKHIAIATFILVMAGQAFAQTSREFVDSANAQYLKQDPKIGSVAPDIQAWDENGDEFQLGSTRGKHTVIIFGCLT